MGGFPVGSPGRSWSELSQVWSGHWPPLERVPANSWISAQVFPTFEFLLSSSCIFEPFSYAKVTFGPKILDWNWLQNDLNYTDNFIPCRVISLPKRWQCNIYMKLQAMFQHSSKSQRGRTCMLRRWRRWIWRRQRGKWRESGIPIDLHGSALPPTKLSLKIFQSGILLTA